MLVMAVVGLGLGLGGRGEGGKGTVWGGGLLIIILVCAFTHHRHLFLEIHLHLHTTHDSYLLTYHIISYRTDSDSCNFFVFSIHLFSRSIGRSFGHVLHMHRAVGIYILI